MSRYRILKRALETQSFESAIGEFHAYAASKGMLPRRELRELGKLMETGQREEGGSPMMDPLVAHSIVNLMPFCPSGEFAPLLNRMIRVFLDQNQPEHSLALMREAQLANTGQIEIEYSTLEKLVLTAKYLGDVEFAWSAIKTMRLHYTNIYSRTWGLFLSLVLSQSHYAALEYIWKEAAIPGYLIFDDNSYTEMARIASTNGNMEMCSWAVIGITERHKFHGRELGDPTLLQVYLIEAVSCPGPSQRQARRAIRAVCRYIVQMQDGGGSVSTRQLPNLLKFLETPLAAEYFEAMFQQMLLDPAAHEMVKLLFFNILLRISGTDTQLQLYHIAQEHQLELNEESVLMFIDLAQTLADPVLLQQVAKRKPSKRVKERHRRALSAIG